MSVKLHRANFKYSRTVIAVFAPNRWIGRRGQRRADWVWRRHERRFVCVRCWRSTEEEHIDHGAHRLLQTIRSLYDCRRAARVDGRRGRRSVAFAVRRGHQVHRKATDPTPVRTDRRNAREAQLHVWRRSRSTISHRLCATSIAAVWSGGRGTRRSSQRRARKARASHRSSTCVARAIDVLERLPHCMQTLLKRTLLLPQRVHIGRRVRVADRCRRERCIGIVEATHSADARRIAAALQNQELLANRRQFRTQSSFTCAQFKDSAELFVVHQILSERNANYMSIIFIIYCCIIFYFM